MNFYNIMDKTMRLAQGSPMETVTMTLSIGNVAINDWVESNSKQTTDVAVPFRTTPKFVLYRSNVFNVFRKQQLFSSSTANVARISVHVPDVEADKTFKKSSPSELVQGIRLLGGMTWAQVAEIFGVSLRAVFDWSAGKAVAAQHHQRLGNVFATLEYIDRGSAEENINLLMSASKDGRTCFELLKTDQCDLVRAVAGEGPKRPLYEKKLSEEAIEYNAPIHFGLSMEEALTDEDVEIVLPREPKVRRAKAKRN